MNVKELAANLGLEEEEYRELIELFIQSGADDLRKIGEGLAAGNADQVMRAAHTIKGAAGNLGLEEVSAAAKVIEMRAIHSQLDDLTGALDILEKHFKALSS